MASQIKDSSDNREDLDVVLGSTAPELVAYSITNTDAETPLDWFASAYNAQSKIIVNNKDENCGKIFPNFLLKDQIASTDLTTKVETDLTTKVDTDLPTKRVQSPRQVKPKEGDLQYDWLREHLDKKYPEEEHWRALELFTEDKLRNTFPEAVIMAQPTRDMKKYDAPEGLMVVRNKDLISKNVLQQCEDNRIHILEANRKLGDNLRKMIDCDTAIPKHGNTDVEHTKNSEGGDSTSENLRPFKKDGTPDMRYKVNNDKCHATSEAVKATKKEVTPEMPPKAYHDKKDSQTEALGPLKMDGTPDKKVDLMNERKDSRSDAVTPLKKDGTPDRRFKSNNEALSVKPPKKVDVVQECLPSNTYPCSGPLKKDGTPDMRYAANSGQHSTSRVSNDGFSGSPKYSYSGNSSGPLTKSGCPDMRYSANRK